MKNKLMLLLVAAVGMNTGVMAGDGASPGQRQPDARAVSVWDVSHRSRAVTGSQTPWKEQAGREVAQDFGADLSTGVTGLFDGVSRDAREAATEVAEQIRRISNLSRAAGSILSGSQETDPKRLHIVGFFYNSFTNLTTFQQLQTFNFEQIASMINQSSPRVTDSPVTSEEVGAAYQALQEKAEALNHQEPSQNLSQAFSAHGKPKKSKSSKKSYTKAGWRGKSTRIARGVIHTANVANMIAELVGGRNAALDALSLNKKLNANKNFVWLRKGKTKSARALRALITIAQTAGIYGLNRTIFNTLVEKADKRDSASRAQGGFDASGFQYGSPYGSPSGTDTLYGSANHRVTAV